MRTVTTPNDFVAKVFFAENHIENDFEIMARCRVAVQVEAARWFEYSFEFEQANRHHDEIRGDVVSSQNIDETVDHLRQFRHTVLQRNIADFIACAATKDRSQVVIYVPYKAKLTLSADIDASRPAVWFNPRTGERVKGKVAKPTPPDTNDWLLVIKS